MNLNVVKYNLLGEISEFEESNTSSLVSEDAVSLKFLKKICSHAMTILFITVTYNYDT